MSRVTFIEANGTEHPVDISEGISLMEAAVQNNVPGIDGDCGGNCACATCHVYVDPAWREAAGTQNEMEAAMLDFAENVQEGSRLACQLFAGGKLDGIILRMPESQH
jgi:2Fe-2S ferredoxin